MYDSVMRTRLEELLAAYHSYDGSAEAREQLRSLWRGTGVLVAAPIADYLGYDVTSYVLDASYDAVTVTILYRGDMIGWSTLMVTLDRDHLAVSNVAYAGYMGLCRITEEAVAELPTIRLADS